MTYAKEHALELGLVDIEPGQESERLDVIGYLDLLVVNHDNFENLKVRWYDPLRQKNNEL